MRKAYVAHSGVCGMPDPTEIVYASALLAWVILLTFFLCKRLYLWGLSKGIEGERIVYYNRKIVHILAGGLPAALVPLLFKSPVVPLALALLLAVLNYARHKTGRLSHWYQMKENIFEVYFCVMWGVTLALGWVVFGNPRVAILPPLFLSVGDGVTGIFRNAILKKRTKSWLGNLAMLLACAPIGYMIRGHSGLAAGVVASFVEHFELGRVDDNITIPLSAFFVLVILG